MGIAERRERDRQIRIKSIQASALKLFSKKGFTAIKMSDISDKAELSIATLYLYFKSKDDLYASLIENALQYLHHQIQIIYQKKNVSLKTKILGFKNAFYKTYEEHHTILRIIIHVQLYDTLLAIDSEILDRLNSLGQKIIAILSETYAEGVRQGKFKRGKAIVHADIMWATFVGLVLLEDSKRKLDSEKDFFKPTLDRAFNIFYAGICRSSPAGKKA